MKFETARLHFISKVFASRRGCSACPSSSSCKCRAWTQATLESINDTLLVFQSMALCHAHWVISQFCRLRKMGWIVVFSFRLVSGSCFLTAQARSKHKMTGGAERVAHINSVSRLKHTSWYMSDHYICLQYLLFLSLIFRLC